MSEHAHRRMVRRAEAVSPCSAGERSGETIQAGGEASSQGHQCGASQHGWRHARRRSGPNESSHHREPDGHGTKCEWIDDDTHSVGQGSHARTGGARDQREDGERA